ncbi:hypothetical protein [Nocardia sp. NBC_01327]|uniref:hypothetical protein n=1 Tax=Nocardia sp. NBC_01327 TaxID=2903593 RepID=UPI002E0EFF67|nr:hypothetical protein OG326_13750 [Nocardia sp. NBC_01327]
MSEEDRARRQFLLGLITVAVLTPLAALCTALAAALGTLLMQDARTRLAHALRREPAPSRLPLPRSATPRPVSPAGTRHPRRGPAPTRLRGRIVH